jgi:hypothetical protein
MAEARNQRSQAENDALQAFICARNCLLYENDSGPELLNVGTTHRPLKIPRSEAWQQSYSMHVLRDCDADHARLLTARQVCRERGAEDQKDWSRAVDLCDQAIRVIEGACGIEDDRIRKILLAVCEYENSRTALGPLIDGESATRELTEKLREIGATMSDVPSPRQLVSWAFPWL